jgi:hypothetical protein
MSKAIAEAHEGTNEKIIQEETKSRQISGNAVMNLLSFCLLSKNVQIKM